MLEPSPDSSNT